MGHIKNKDTKINYRVWIITGFIFMVLIVGTIFTSNDYQRQDYKTEYNYTLRLSNWVGGSNYQFDYYKKDGETYKLYNKDSVLINEIIPTDGYAVIITKNK